jgi:DNA polymerase-3 subunit gamma/tau
MAYLALYRTYRPKTFSEVVGQKAVVKTLQNALSEGKIAHAYLFCGPRGTGKTTMARLFAKALNCTEGVGHECNKCENCTDILEGKHPDVFEIDAASNSGVDNVRRLIEQVSFAPILGRYKVYIIDEVHSMSSSAFNALLKTLEEPPANVVFILATTEPDKVLPTILSRVQRFDFSKVSDSDLVSNMANILGKEGIDYEEPALKIIARLSQGGVRDSLSLLDQAISYCGKKINTKDVNDLFGLLSISDEIDLVRLIHLNDIKGALSIIKDKYAHGADVLRLHEDLTDIYKDLLIYGTTKDASLLTILMPEEAQKLLVTPSEIRRNLKALIAARRDYRTALNAYDEFEMTVISMAYKPDDEASDLSETAKPQPVIKPIETAPSFETAKPSPVSEAPAIKPAPAPTPAKPAEPVKAAPSDPETEPKTITSSTIERYDEVSPSNGDGFELTKDQVINCMVQGRKQEKNDLLKVWDKTLADYPKSDALSDCASFLAACQPCIVCEDFILVKSFFKGIVKSINQYGNQPRIQSLMEKAFQKKYRVAAISNSDYVDYVREFLNMSQASSLPDPKPIVIGAAKAKPADPSSPHTPTSAENFLNALNSDDNKNN